MVSLLLGGTILYQFRSGLRAAPQALPYFYLLVGLYYLQALLLAIIQRRPRILGPLVHFQVVWDILFVTGLIFLTGGIESIFSFIYILVIVGAGFLLGRKETILAASASAILYGSLLDLQFYGYLPWILGMPTQVDGADVFYAVFVHVVAFLLVGVLSGTVSERLKRSEQALEKREIDYEELENLNRAILANIGSGLMIINPQGRIRSFNAAASRITGYPLETVYDRPVTDFLPNLNLFDEGMKSVPRGETHFSDPGGGVRNLGYSASPLDDVGGEPLGMLVTFQDLTQLKKLEQRLHRADRLAAVGQLASGLAHEIRNPLASISGSVQLLMENEDISPEERRLMQIVVREADRLSALLTDFLVFARPSPPELGPTDISSLLDELCVMVRSDGRFSQVELHRNYRPRITMQVDSGQFRQGIWNLLINAAEAMPGGGDLSIDVDTDRCEIRIDDSGPGIPDEVMGKIFDPFFTTKDNGTGLGLATVYAIFEGHGGEVRVGSNERGGARFTVHLPQLRTTLKHQKETMS